MKITMDYLINDYQKIILHNLPLIDVRAPIEYQKGALPNSINIPILDDQQRHLVGIQYKQQGNEEATKLGYQLVAGTDRETKIQKLVDFVTQSRQASDSDSEAPYIYCFRGGSRSKIACHWVNQAIDQPVYRIEGGYKQMRNYLIDSLKPENLSFAPLRLGGKTGSGKTIFLNQNDFSIDLEGIANHRGSAFGNYITPQPNQINFENQLAYQIIQKSAQGYRHLLFEDEGKHIGRCYLPTAFSDYYRHVPLILLEVPFEARVAHITQEYVLDSQARYIAAYQEEGLAQWLDYILASITKVKKKLGAVKYNSVTEEIKTAYHRQLSGAGLTPHHDWIADFLAVYYDPMYDYQIQKNTNIIFKGNQAEILDFLRTHYSL